VDGTETILVVEDEPMVRQLACKALSAHGYRVLEAMNAIEGLQIAMEYAGSIHLLLTDVVMPQMNGQQLCDRVTIIRPEIKVLYMSGYTDNEVIRHGLLDEGINFLQKPFTIQSLAQKIREVLSQSAN
jgi:DNA-binding NtrC family response regulator